MARPIPQPTTTAASASIRASIGKHHLPEDKAKLRAVLDDHVRAFLMQGGSIQKAAAKKSSTADAGDAQ